MGTTTLTAETAAANGFFGLLGGIIATVGIFALIFYILLIIAQWKIFEKAGEAGWKSLPHHRHQLLDLHSSHSIHSRLNCCPRRQQPKFCPSNHLLRLN